MKTGSICVPVCERYADDLPNAVSRASEAGDIVELRLDCLEEGQLKRAEPDISAALSRGNGPFIITFRPGEQGGSRPLTMGNRTSFISRKREDGWQGSLTLWDIELDLALFLKKSEEYPGSICDWERTICSHHDFTETPEDIGAIYEAMAGTAARILKIAVHANDITDCIAVFKLLDRARHDGREMIAISMGLSGIATRILGPSRGAFLTYGAIDDEHRTAPGQILSDQLRDMYRIQQLNRDTEITGLMGAPVRHSVSPQMHNAAFAAGNLNAVYIPFQVADAGKFIRRMVDPKTREMDWNLRGLSVTSPHKTEVIPHLDWIEPSAREIGAVNTIVVRDDQLLGYNKDVESFLGPLRRRAGPLTGLRCAVIGAGGAARAVLWGLKKEGVDSTIFARRPEGARLLADEFGVTSEEVGPASFRDFDVVINATPAGSLGQSDPSPVNESQLLGAGLAYDLIYNPPRTPFLKEAEKAGCGTIGGLDMLVGQAAAQFELWTGHDAPFQLMYEAAIHALSGRY